MADNAMSQLGWTFIPDNPVYQVRDEPEKEIRNGRGVMAFLHSRTIICPACKWLIPLAPNWRLSQKPDMGIRLKPDTAYRIVGFEVVAKAEESRGTIRKGIAICPMCGYVCPKGYPAAAARADRMGHIEYCRVIKTYYPIYQGAEQKPIQGVKPLEYRVPNDHLLKSDEERWRALASKGWLDMTTKEDTLLLELGIFGGTESEFAPGIANLYRLSLHPDQDDDDDEIC